jgi:hypothetical protein
MLCALTYPSALTFLYFVLLAAFSAGVQQTAYGVGKLVQFGFPAVYVWMVLREQPRWSLLSAKGISPSLVFGVLVSAAMLLLYEFWLSGSAVLVGLERQVVDKVRDLGLHSAWRYAATGVFYALVHSLLEEYYWRWFVFGQLRKRAGVRGAILLSSLGFMAHHVILLATYFGWDSPLAYVLSFGVALGGVAWAWLYARTGSLLGPWLSHMLIDAAIFLIGYDLARAAVS